MLSLLAMEYDYELPACLSRASSFPEIQSQSGIASTARLDMLSNKHASPALKTDLRPLLTLKLIIF